MSDSKKISAIIIGLCFILGGLYFSWQSVNLLKNYERAAGVVKAEKSVKIEDNSRRRNSNNYGNVKNYPVVVFNAKDGKEYMFMSKVSVNLFSPKVNDRVFVLYNPQNPIDAEISSFGTLWVLPISLFFAAALSFLPIIFQEQFNSIMALFFKTLKNN